MTYQILKKIASVNYDFYLRKDGCETKVKQKRHSFQQVFVYKQPLLVTLFSKEDAIILAFFATRKKCFCDQYVDHTYSIFFYTHNHSLHNALTDNFLLLATNNCRNMHSFISMVIFEKEKFTLPTIPVLICVF